MTTLNAKLEPLLERVLKGETVEVGIFQVWEDFLYTRKKNADGSPQWKRVISFVYFDEDEESGPSTEDFDGTMDSFIACLDAHDAIDSAQALDWDEEECLVELLVVTDEHFRVDGIADVVGRSPSSVNQIGAWFDILFHFPTVEAAQKAGREVEQTNWNFVISVTVNNTESH